MSKHSAADSTHSESRTYPGTKNGAGAKALERKLVAEGKVKPGTTPHEGGKK